MDILIKATFIKWRTFHFDQYDTDKQTHALTCTLHLNKMHAEKPSDCKCYNCQECGKTEKECDTYNYAGFMIILLSYDYFVN